MTNSEQQSVAYEDVQAAIDRIEEQVMAEDWFGASRKMMVEGTLQRLRDEIRHEVEP